jgi:WD40 repeat protein
MLQDANRFVLNSKTGIEATPLQIYASALIFSPETSLTKQKFVHEMSTIIKSCYGVERSWSPLLQTMEVTRVETCNGLGQSAVFSPDRLFLASFSLYRSFICIWDTETGTLRRKLKVNRDHIWRVAFSPNNLCIAAVGLGSIARMWTLDEESDQRPSRIILVSWTVLPWYGTSMTNPTPSSSRVKLVA